MKPAPPIDAVVTVNDVHVRSCVLVDPVMLQPPLVAINVVPDIEPIDSMKPDDTIKFPDDNVKLPVDTVKVPVFNVIPPDICNPPVRTNPPDIPQALPIVKPPVIEAELLQIKAPTV